MGESDLGWLQSKFHFSFANYYDQHNTNFGVLRVINDDIVQPHSGFDTHPHTDMEIVSYVLDGKLSHKDSMGYCSELQRGHVQYLSAGTGITHSEYNNEDSKLRLLQIWIYPNAKNLVPQYGEKKFDWFERVGKLMPIASGNGNYPITINQDVHMDALWLQQGETFEYNLSSGRQCYVVLAEGQCTLNGLKMSFRDGAKVSCAETIAIETVTDSHFLFVEMAKA